MKRINADCTIAAALWRAGDQTIVRISSRGLGLALSRSGERRQDALEL